MSSCADGEFWEGFTRGCFPGTQQRSHCGSTCAFPTPLERQHHRRRGCRGRCATWELLQVRILNQSSPFFPGSSPRESLPGAVLLLGQTRSGRCCSTWALAASSMSSVCMMPGNSLRQEFSPSAAVSFLG